MKTYVFSCIFLSPTPEDAQSYANQAAVLIDEDPARQAIGMQVLGSPVAVACDQPLGVVQ